RQALRGAIDAPALELAPPGSNEASFGPDGMNMGGAGETDGAGSGGGAAPPASSHAGASAFASAFAYVPEPSSGSGADAASTGDGVSRAAPGRDEALPANVTLFPAHVIESRAANMAHDVEFTGAPCLQIHGSFILVAVRGGFLLVNQRAAHERILYEKALDDLRKPGRFSAQQLLFPEVVEFGAAEARLVEKHAAELRGLGFDLEPFGSTAFQLRGSPADAPSDQAQAILQDLVGRLMDDTPRGKDAPDEIHKRVARAYARAAAVPLDTPLDAPRMAALVDGLFATQN